MVMLTKKTLAVTPTTLEQFAFMECDHIKALDLAREGNWDESHNIVQQYSDKLACLIHAYLHRVERLQGSRW